MAGFYIERIIAGSDTKEDAIVTFTKGMNLIQGRSETGKTSVLKSIAFAFGADIKPFDANTGYSNITMIVMSDEYGRIVVNRKLGKNQIDVNCESNQIENGLYDIKYKTDETKQKHPVINELWLKLIGVYDLHMICKNGDFKKERLSWYNLLKLMYIDENRISQEEPLFEPQNTYEKTPFLASLLFLFTGQDFSETDAKTKKEIRVARKKAVEEYVNRKIQDATKRREELASQLDVFGDVDIEEKISGLVKSLEKTERAITQSMGESQELLSSILQVEEKAAECEVLLSRYKNLENQYKADVNRLMFIVNGEAEIPSVSPNSICPFCDGKIAPRERKSYIEASRAELSRIITQMKGLEETTTEVLQEKLEIQNELTKLKSKRADIEQLITQQLKPKAAELSDGLKAYRAYVQLDNERKLVAEFARSWGEDLNKLPEEEDDAIKFRPKEYFDSDFRTAMDDYAYSITDECKYEQLTAARFNIQDFDIEVNGCKKAYNHGQGYRAFLNSVVALMFRKYLAEHAKYNLGLLMIDTPLLGLDQGVDDAAPYSMRTGLFKYFMKNQNGGQLIVVENKEHVPELNYKEHGVNVITFTKGREEGRYGFLHGIR